MDGRLAGGASDLSDMIVQTLGNSMHRGLCDVPFRTKRNCTLAMVNQRSEVMYPCFGRHVLLRIVL